MDTKHVSPTYMELTRLKKRLATTIREHKLLKDRRDELTRQFLDLVHENKALHEKVEAGIAAANQDFALARSGMTDEALNVALMVPKQEAYLGSGTRNIMGVEIPVFKYKTRASDPNDIYSYGSALTSSDLDNTVKSLADLLPDMLHLAECEKSCQLMAAEIEKVRHRVSALEHIMTPESQQNIRYVTMKLDEDERNSQIRLMRVRDMMAEEAHHHSKREVVLMVDEA